MTGVTAPTTRYFVIAIDEVPRKDIPNSRKVQITRPLPSGGTAIDFVDGPEGGFPYLSDASRSNDAQGDADIIFIQGPALRHSSRQLFGPSPGAMPRSGARLVKLLVDHFCD